MNRLFSELLKKFGGACLEVCDTISAGIWEVVGGKIKENYSEKIEKKIRKVLLDTIKYCFKNFRYSILRVGCRCLYAFSSLKTFCRRLAVWPLDS